MGPAKARLFPPQYPHAGGQGLGPFPRAGRARLSPSFAVPLLRQLLGAAGVSACSAAPGAGLGLPATGANPTRWEGPSPAPAGP